MAPADQAITTTASLRSSMARTASRIEGDGEGSTVCIVVTTGFFTSSRNPLRWSWYTPSLHFPSIDEAPVHVP